MSKMTEIRPRAIDTAQYVRDRLDQITELLEVIDNSSSTSANVTSGPRTLFQRLPRHMRRRAMSYNIKRLPRSLRDVVKRLAVHRKKAPSRKWRRRPTRLLKKLQRLRRQNVWLETHIWHAKRFKMIDLWGWKIPFNSFQRNFRPTFRNAKQSAIIYDLSYFCCTLIQVDLCIGYDALSKKLSKMCVPFVSYSFEFNSTISDSYEQSVLLYKPGLYPYGFLGPARFMWTINKLKNICQLIIWSHPSAHTQIFQTVVDLLDVKIVNEIESKKCLEQSNIKLNDLKTLRTPQEIIVPPIYKSLDFTVTNLRHDVVRLRLIGSKIFVVLKNVLNLVNNKSLEELNLLDKFRDSHKFWRESICNNEFIQVGNFRSGTIISLLVEDPRLYYKHKTSLNVCSKNIDNENFPIINTKSPKPFTALFWDNEFCKEQLKNRLTNAQLEKARQDHSLGGLKTTKFKIPILLIIQSKPTKNNLSVSFAHNCIDLLAPSGTGLDFWISLQFANVRAAGLLDKVSLNFEKGICNFPIDCADSASFFEYNKIESNAAKIKNLKKPLNRRLKYYGHLHVKYPFTFNWLELINDWKILSLKCNSFEKQDFYVLRDKRVLIKLNSWFTKKQEKCVEHNDNVLEQIFQCHQNALIPITMQHNSSGRTKRFALICLPLLEDLELLKLNKKAIIMEPKVNQVSKEINDEIIEKSLPKKLKLEEFIALDNLDDATTQKKMVRLNDLFPDEELFLRKKKIAKKLKRKECIKKKLINKSKNSEINIIKNDVECFQNSDNCLLQTSNKLNFDENIKINQRYINSCSRQIIGRVVSGDYSFLKSKSVAFGYCSLLALKSIKSTNNKVLLRNNSSKYYHLANVSINLYFDPEL